MIKVAVIMGSASDWDVMSPCCATLEEFGIPTGIRARWPSMWLPRRRRAVK